MSNYTGMDYGMGKTNLDPKTGIRFGVIHLHNLHECIYETLEAQYGDPCCPQCGREVMESPYGKDYFCEDCASESGICDAEGELNEGKTKKDLDGVTYWSDQVFSDSPIGQTLETKEYSAHNAFDSSSLFITRSLYYTFSGYCSPLRPWSWRSDNPTPDGVKTFCFSHDMFEGNKAPYPVYLVANDSLVNPE